MRIGESTPHRADSIAAFSLQSGKEIWAYSKELFDDAVRCNVGKDCRIGKKFAMKEVAPTPADRQVVADAAKGDGADIVVRPAGSGLVRLEGLDIHEHGVPGYVNDDMVQR